MRQPLADRPVVAVKYLLAGVGMERRGRLISDGELSNRGRPREEMMNHDNGVRQAV